MIGFLKGQVLECEAGRLILMAGPVGYSVQVPQTADFLLLRTGQDLDLWIHTHVREDDLQLFGFSTRMERELFLTLTAVSGVGPKVGLALISGIPAGELIQTLLSKTTPRLTEVSGVGKKLAERIVLEAHDSVRKKVESGALMGGAITRSIPSTGATAKDRTAPIGNAYSEARVALLGLGYRESDFATVLAEESAERSGEGARVEDILRRTLQRLG